MAGFEADDLVSNRDKLIHDLSDRLNSVSISVELAIRLLEQQSGDAKVSQVLERVREDCTTCSETIARLREAD